MNIINLFTTQNNLTLKRVNESATTNNEGMVVDPARTSTLFTGSIQPMPNEQLLNLEEGQRTRDPKIIYTTTLLKTVDQNNQLGADFITWNGVDYEVIEVENLNEWDGAGLAHYEVLILRKDI